MPKRSLCRRVVAATVLVALALTGCTAPGPSGPPVHPDALAAAAPQLSRLFIYRDASSILGDTIFGVVVNGAEVGSITSGTYMYLDVKPGTYTVSLTLRKPDDKTEIPSTKSAAVAIGPTGDYYVRMSHISLGSVIAVAALAGATAGVIRANLGGPVLVPTGAGSPAVTPEAVPPADGAAEIKTLAYSPPTLTSVPGQTPKLGLSYVMADGSGGRSVAPGGRVTLVLPDSAAARAGIMPGDVILSVGDAPVTALYSVHEALRGFAPGKPVAIVFLHQGQRSEVSVTL